MAIYFQDGIIEHMEEIPSYTAIQFINAFGGALSLYLGMCLVSGCELVEAIFRFVVALLDLNTKTQRRKVHLVR